LSEYELNETRLKSQVLRQLKFFDRFSDRDLEQMLDMSALKVLDEGDVILPEKDRVFIIVNGTCIVYDHRLTYDEPEIVNFYQMGDIIGEHRLDEGLFCRPEVWVQVTSYKMELL
jgi:signal-transduction protein with cAMP-binding, CBS, and nucleotidyltransferase domain